MAGKKELSSYQKGIVRRYYENREAISSQKLGEIVTDLYLCESEKKAERLWERVEKALAHSDANPAQVKQVLAERNVERLAELVNGLF